MEAITFGLALGVTSTLFWLLLPNNSVVILLFGVAFVCIFYRYRFLAALLIGVAWAAFFFHCTTNWLQNENISMEHKHLLQITVQDLQLKHDNYQIIAAVEAINGHRYWWHPKVKLSASKMGQQLNTNDRLLIQASLKLPHNLNNLGSFDSVRWLLGKGITATGKIIEVRRLEKSETGWRDWWLKQVQSQLRLLQSSGLIMALIFGEQSLVEQDEWRLLRNHGLIHLMAISGMHIGLIGWFGTMLSRFIMQKFHQISPQLHWIPGLLFASFYAVHIPAHREQPFRLNVNTYSAPT